MSLLRIAGGRVVDPANGVEDAVGDVWIEDGRVVAAPAEGTRADRTIDARGYVVMPGGVDVHCHIAGPKVNAARAMRPEERREATMARRDGLRSGTLGSVPSTFATGYLYAGLGYTTAVDAAVAPSGARHARHELGDTPAIDKAFLVLMGNHHYVMEQVRRGERERLRAFVAWLLGATGGFGVKVVDPGGVERWKQGKGGRIGLDDEVDGFGVTPRQVLVGLATAADELALPHPVHVHGPGLGLPGNAATTLELMRSLDGRRAHLAHVQFHSYGGDPADAASMDSQVPLLADYVNAHVNLSLDVGQVLFGPTTSMTADSPVGQYLHSLRGRKWLAHDVELETGCGVVPIEYKDSNLVHALQWAIGLEWFLRVEDPWQVALSTDHPNGASFLAYPELIALLMDRNLRDEMWNRLPERARARSGLGDLGREYSLADVAVVTRAAPARMLGLAAKGHLGPGADGDVTVYAPDADRRRMFSLPRYVIKSGVVVVDDGDLRHAPDGPTLRVAPDFDPGALADIAAWHDAHSTVRFRNIQRFESEHS
ncbi:MAG TPA: formylmethanofuran dehydrogenase subunit A [Isosphaeraceae bacterium]|jgi:formylmethanofuran dehydrogenase subunit A|nr:formylmethanofuran dehydrogenase subunit A [Isosphaeraceae bacterium]